MGLDKAQVTDQSQKAGEWSKSRRGVKVGDLEGFGKKGEATWVISMLVPFLQCQDLRGRLSVFILLVFSKKTCLGLIGLWYSE